MTTPDQKLVSEIPSAHPHKAAIEARFTRLLATLGSDWAVSILVEDHANLGVCLQQIVSGRPIRFWSTAIRPKQQNAVDLERWLRGLGRIIQDELGLSMGFRVLVELTADQRAVLRTLIAFYRGGFTRDGMIVVPREDRTAFLDETDALGVDLEVTLWPRGERRVYPVESLRGNVP